MIAAFTAAALAAAAPSSAGGLRPERPIVPSIVHQVIVGGEAENDPVIKRTVVQLLRKTKAGTGNCTAAAIAPRVLLTAAHCFMDKSNDHKIKSGKGTTKVAGYIAHPGFKYEKPTTVNGTRIGAKTENDIAVVFLARDVARRDETFGLLGKETPISIDDMDGVEVTLSGYGMTKPDDRSTLGELRSIDAGMEEMGDTNLLAFGFFNTCQGDSGGPAYAARNGKRIVVGVSSTADCEGRGQFTRVSDYADWIVEQVRARGYEIDDPVRVDGQGFGLPAVPDDKATPEAVGTSVDESGGGDSPLEIRLPAEYPTSGSYATRADCESAGEAWNAAEQKRCNGLDIGGTACHVNRNYVQTNWRASCELMQEQVAARVSLESAVPDRSDPPGFPKPGLYASKDDCIAEGETWRQSEYGPACSQRIGCQQQMAASMTRWNEACDNAH